MIAIAASRQTIFDVCIWKYGTLQEISRLVRDNSMNYDNELTPGDQITYTSGIGLERNKRFFERNFLIPSSVLESAITSGSGIGYWTIGTTFKVK